MLYLNSDRVNQSLEGNSSLVSLLESLGHKDLSVTCEPVYRVNRDCENFLINHLGIEPLKVEPVEVIEEPKEEKVNVIEEVAPKVLEENSDARKMIKQFYKIQYLRELSELKISVSQPALIGYKALEILIKDLELLRVDLYSFIHGEYEINLESVTYSDCKEEVKIEMSKEYSCIKTDTVSLLSVNTLLKPVLAEVATSLINQMKISTLDCREFYAELEEVIKRSTLM